MIVTLRLASNGQVRLEVVPALHTVRGNPRLDQNRTSGQFGLDRIIECPPEHARNPLVAAARRRHRDNNPVEQLIVPLVARAAVEEILNS